MQSRDFTREELWAKQDISFSDINYNLWEEKKPVLKQMSSISSSCIFTVDVYKSGYNFASENFADFFGYTHRQIKNIGQYDNFLEEKIHPDDRDQIIKIQISHGMYIYSLPKEQRNDYRNIFQFRMLNAKKQFVNVISRHQVLLKDKNDKAWIIMGILDISPDQDKLESVKYSSLNIKTGNIITPSLTCCSVKLLTQRETEILQLIRRGFLSKEISYKLNISIHTVNNHRKNILAKLNTDNSIEAINIAEKTGIL